MSFGGSNTKTQQKQLGSIADYTTTFGKSTAATGTSNLDAVSKYWTGILSGSRPAQMAAAAPEINAANEADAAQRAKESAFGTSRGGGTNAAAQNAETQRMTNVNNSLFGAREKAATGLESVGVEQMKSGLQAIGLSEEAINGIIQGKKADAETSHSLLSDIGTGIGMAVLAYKKP
jgi:hypothetical protein